jgi:type I restriction enzyme S subunit
MTESGRLVLPRDGWREVTLAEVCNFAGGYAFPRKLQGRGEGTYPFFKVSDMNAAGNERTLTAAANWIEAADLTAIKGKVASPGTVVFPKVGAALKTEKRRLLGIAGLFDNNVMGLLAGPAILPEFLLIAMETVRLADIAQEGVVPSVNQSQVGSVTIPLPPLAEQHRICDLLSHVDATLRQTTLEHHAGETLSRALVDGTMEAAADQRVLSDVAEVRSGLAKGRKLTGAVKRVPFLRAANVQDGWLDLAEMHEIDVAADDVERYRLQEGDVLLIEGSGTPARLGTGWIWESVVPGCIHQNHVFAVRADGHVHSRWLAYWITSRRAREYFRSCVKTSSGLGTINKRQVSQLPVPVPSLDVQTERIQVLDAARKVADGVASKNDALLRLRAALIGALLSGSYEITAESYDRLLGEKALPGLREPATV